LDLYERILNRQEKIAVIGLGYVGLPIAVAFAKKAQVIGFNRNQAKIELYQAGIDVTKEVGDEAVRSSTVEFTANPDRLKEARFHIVTVPTPVTADRKPDLEPLEKASELLGKHLSKGSVVVYESTVYPGVTEEVCVPILEEHSGLKCGSDFKVGYSPERINPGDPVNRLENIVKIVSAMDEETLDTVAKVYEMVVEAGVYKAGSIKVAEAAKVIENCQRDINIAFMNELSVIFNKMGIDTQAVLKAANTKWNFLPFVPGLVGGHCIGVDPYYLTYAAEKMGYHSQVILSGRKINDDVGKYVAEHTVKLMIKADKQVKGSRVVIYGVTFKENCPDVRNTKVVDIINELEEYGVEVMPVDLVADAESFKQEYNLELCKSEEVRDVDAVIFAVAHDDFKALSLQDLEALHFKTNIQEETGAVAERNSSKIDAQSAHNGCVLVDVKGIFDRREAENAGFLYWRL